MRWAVEAKEDVQIQPIVRFEDKGLIGELVASAPDDLQIIGGIDFVDLIRSDIGVRYAERASCRRRRYRATASTDGARGHSNQRYHAPQHQPHR